MTQKPSDRQSLSIPKPELDQLFSLLKSQGYCVIGPSVADNAIVYAEISSTADLPRGYRDSQEPGKYRVSKTPSESYFEFNLGPHSWKQFLYPPARDVALSQRVDGKWVFQMPQASSPKYAFVGVRACELAAIRIQDKVFLEGPFVDHDYKARREAVFIIAVNCTVAAETCFCTSMGTGPKCTSGFDLAMTELADAFLIEAGSGLGSAVLEALGATAATPSQENEAATLEHRAVEQIQRRLNTSDIHNLLMNNLNHPRWDDVASRCLSCTNCTMVCPTCFCSSVTELSDLDGDEVRRQRNWDSCFNPDFGYTSGEVVRNDIRSRYRQWLTHKFASWIDQFGTSGCVGCGRCITWCPVGIDVTAEIEAIRLTPNTSRMLPVIQPSKTACRLNQEGTV